MNIQVIKTKRKTIALQIKDLQTIVVRAPMRISDQKIGQFIQSKKGWIEKTLAKLMQEKQFENTFDFTKNIYLLGEKHMATEFNLLEAQPNTQNKLVYENIYKKFAKKLLPSRAEDISKSIGLNYKSLKIGNSKHYWGSYNKNGIMRLNYKLVILPENLITYVIIHELCHSRFFNHSKQFWNLVKTYCPEYKTSKALLDKYGFIL